MVASRRPLQRSRLQSALQSSSLSALQQVAGHCPRSAESLLRDGHRNGRVSAAVTTVAPTISLLTWVKCPASMLRDGHYNGRVSAAVTTVSPMQSCLHVVGLGRSTSWASIERARQSVPASRAEGELHQQGCPKDAGQRTRAKGREPKDASQRTQAKGRKPKDASQRARAKEREPKGALDIVGIN